MCINHAGKKSATPLKLGSQNEQIPILTEQHSPQFRGSRQQNRIVGFVALIFAGREHINAAQANAFDDLDPNVVIRIEGNTHGSVPRRLSRS